MIRNRVAELLGARRQKMADLARGTGLSRNTVQRLYHGSADRIDLDTVDRLCRYFGVGVGEIFVYVPDENPSGPAQ